MAWLRESGQVRFVSSVTEICRSGSIQREVPVYPRWPKDRGEKYCPDCDGAEGVSQPSAREVSAGKSSRQVNIFTVSGRSISPPPFNMAVANIATSSEVEKSPAWAAT